MDQNKKRTAGARGHRSDLPRRHLVRRADAAYPDGANSFEAAQIETNINRLTQDVEDDQAKLDQLVANLPDKASDMGMVPQQGSVSIDLSGYQSNKGGTQ